MDKYQKDILCLIFFSELHLQTEILHIKHWQVHPLF